ncbi:Various environmental stresses-induced protein [Raoultella ornithinolytica]|nr:Various environmental stresses-induced protein [Raoultella ornithinolytica]
MEKRRRRNPRIVSVPSPDADAPFLWRASIATLEHDGPFSRFSGIDRVITLIEGQPLWLRGEGIHHHLRRWEPWAFSGEWALGSEGISAPGLDFNIMTQRTRAAAQVSVVSVNSIPVTKASPGYFRDAGSLPANAMTRAQGSGGRASRPGP